MLFEVVGSWLRLEVVMREFAGGVGVGRIVADDILDWDLDDLVWFELLDHYEVCLHWIRCIRYFHFVERFWIGRHFLNEYMKLVGGGDIARDGPIAGCGV